MLKIKPISLSILSFRGVTGLCIILMMVITLVSGCAGTQSAGVVEVPANYQASGSHLDDSQTESEHADDPFLIYY